MDAPANWFEKITGFKPMVPPTEGPLSHNHRSEVRIPFTLRTQACPIIGGMFAPPFAVQLREMTSAGIGLIHGTEVNLTAKFAVLLRHKKLAGRGFIATCDRIHVKIAQRTVAVIGARIISVEVETDGSPFAEPAKRANQVSATEVARIREAILR